MMFRATSALVLSAIVTACSGGRLSSPVAPTPVTPLSERAETDHVVFRFAAGDAVDWRRQEAHRDWVVERLAVSLPSKVQYFKYLSTDQMSALTGRSAQGFAVPERLEVHSIYAFHPHEAVHVYSALIGRPSDFFNEGLAVALANDPFNSSFEGRYNNQPVHLWARRNQGLLRSIPNMVTTEAFRRVEDATGYPQAGSFIEFLLESEGFAPMRDFFGRGRTQDTLETIRATFEASFGFSLGDAETRWRAFLASGG